jgi:ABC-type dipeptide/oligopeptide/nickel transport systems, permease components
MLKFILKRTFLETIPSLLVIITITFFLIRLAPGGPFSGEKSIDPQVLAQLNSHYGLDKPLFVQYVNYLANICHGDFGPSFKYPNRSVTELIGQSFPVSLELGLYALAFAVLFGIGAGIVASLRPNTFSDYAPMSIAMVGICVPTFVLGPILILVFGLHLEIFNVSGWAFPRDRVLPALTLGMAYVAYIARLTRGGMLEMLFQDFIRTARAKGVSELHVVLKHALRGGLLPVVSFLGPAAAGLITGSFVVETIFQIPGLGRFFVMAAFNRDYTMIMGIVLFYAFLIIMLNTIVDVALTMLNPRLRFK